MVEHKASRGLEGALVKLCGGGDYELTVAGRTEITPNYLRLHFTAERLLAEQRLHPTMWVRGWFPHGDKAHQRGYTLVNPDPEAGTVDIDFAMHDGVATGWASAAQPGDVLEVTVLGSNFSLPEPQPAGYVIVGDAASLPAINSLLDAIGDAPARVFLEAGHDDDRELPVAGDAEITWVDREELVDVVSSSAFDAADHFGWVACNNRTTRAVAKVFREEYGIPRKSIKAQAYWAA
ncbi:MULTISPECIES: siderophore-interacting protein [Mycolicibacterium]|uniref:Iron import ATP-binding/permease protein IrtA n=1 Tax=Mycolicibacterium mageritense TaxID=53462 RepID=A0AAI8TP01_MYCME|nr:siderophore-interacting protein [Mycolicibacterium mageritense]TXH25415.1 MAG: siderophore-interacting protein [Mycobacterium sp.]BDY26209.1 Iron import ATP-binding/permease protein IrtA [Mycolicibacterium mageritense]GJJ16883.1 siderophore-interacting protein [Mycolicibacterium mageritense]